MNVIVNKSEFKERGYGTMANLGKLLKFIISVSDLSRGQASKIIKEVSEKKSHYLIVKNNRPEAVILPVEDYLRLTELEEDRALLMIAEARMETYEAGKKKSLEEVLNDFEVTKDDLKEVEVEIE